MNIFVATYEDGSGYPYQKVFRDKPEAEKWLRKQYDRDQDGVTTTKEFKEWCRYGAWTGKIRKHII
jgi:hypothetical protein